jgi:flagellar biosynthesis protein FlgN
LIDNSSDNSAAGLPSHLKNERDFLRSFIALLEKEQQALLVQDSEQLLTLADAKNQAVNKLAELSNIRRRQMNLDAAKLDTSAWIQKNAPSCRAVWDEIRELAARAHHLNQTNGEVIQLKLRSNQQALTVLLGASQSAAGLYGRDGQPSLPITGRTLGNG